MGTNTHWHTFSYTGHERPRDSEARNPQSPTPPNDLNMWFRKPTSMMAGTFTQQAEAYDWLEQELLESPPPQTAVSVELHMQTARDALNRTADVYVGYYTAHGRFLIRAALTCPRPRERCPAPPTRT